MAIASDAPATPERKRLAWASDSALVRALGRIPLPIGGKLLIGFAVVAALLALVAAIGLVSLNQSNSRGRQLRGLQQAAAYAQLLAGDANQLVGLVGGRGGGGGGNGGGQAGGGGAGGAAYAAVDNDVFTSWTLFSQDVEHPLLSGGSGGLRQANPQFVRKLEATLTAFHSTWQQVNLIDLTGQNTSAFLRYYNKAAELANQAYTQASSLTQRTRAKADGLVNANQRGFVNSRNLLIGVGAGSLMLALALGLLLSWSVVAPLRRTQTRLSEIAGGNFAAHIDVSNR